jgi:hypothetical protein
VRRTYSKYVTAMHISGNGSAEPVWPGLIPPALA